MNGQILPGTGIAVDFWKIKGQQQNLVHFLTHVHGDHIVGLTSSWMTPIYCSEFTAQILEAHYGVSKAILKVLPLNQCTLIKMPNSADTFCVTAFDANHCPGAVMLYFEGKFGNIFHTGDFRFSKNVMSEYLQPLSGKIDTLYFDNTFCSPECVFPTREECLDEIIEIAKKHSNSDILIGMRKLGKESMLAKLGVALNETIYISPERLKITQRLFECNVFSICSKEERARIRAVPFNDVSRKRLYDLNTVTPTIAILPSAIFTGLSCKPFSRDKDIYVVPYSDHSSFPELVKFVRELQPRRLIPIVNQSRGPFKTDISDRADMTLFASYVKMSDASSDNMNPETCDSPRYVTITSKENYLGKEKYLVLNHNNSCEHVSPDSSSSNDSITNSYQNVATCDKDLSDGEHDMSTGTVVSLKRKHSFPHKRKKKLATGVIFENESLESSSTAETDKIALNLHTPNTNNISSHSLSFETDTLEDMFVECQDMMSDQEVSENEMNSNTEYFSNSNPANSKSDLQSFQLCESSTSDTACEILSSTAAPVISVPDEGSSSVSNSVVRKNTDSEAPCSDSNTAEGLIVTQSEMLGRSGQNNLQGSYSRCEKISNFSVDEIYSNTECISKKCSNESDTIFETDCAELSGFDEEVRDRRSGLTFETKKIIKLLNLKSGVRQCLENNLGGDKKRCYDVLNDRWFLRLKPFNNEEYYKAVRKLMQKE